MSSPVFVEAFSGAFLRRDVTGLVCYIECEHSEWGEGLPTLGLLLSSIWSIFVGKEYDVE
jgi:hypothetical protein